LDELGKRMALLNISLPGMIEQMKETRNHDLDTLDLLARGEMELLGRFVDSWNQVLLVRVSDAERESLAIYKPCQGEYPLWDFPHATLCLRERAAYLVGRALGWPFIPPTVLRDGVLGWGMVQLHVEADPEATYFTLRDDRLDDLMSIALFDCVANNADRKGGHLLLDAEGRIWCIDQALTFHAEPKLRTVIWDFAGEPIPPSYMGDLRRLRQGLAVDQPLARQMSDLLASDEMTAFRERVDRVLALGTFPFPEPGSRYLPWPLV
jgi:uncharacterized repeat protein (TIGR03843 family)